MRNALAVVAVAAASIAASIVASIGAHAQDTVDAPLEMVRPIVDTSGALGESEAGLSRRLHDHKDDSGVAVGIVIMPTLGSGKLTDAVAAWDTAFVDGFARDAHAGKASVLVVIALNERKLQIDNGVDVELDSAVISHLTGSASKAFAKNDVAGGVALLVSGLIDATPRPVTHVNVGFVASAAASALFLVAALVAIVRTMRRERSQTG